LQSGRPGVIPGRRGRALDQESHVGFDGPRDRGIVKRGHPIFIEQGPAQPGDEIRRVGVCAPIRIEAVNARAIGQCNGFVHKALRRPIGIGNRKPSLREEIAVVVEQGRVNLKGQP
jgi:hypothetical protein